MDLDLEDIEKKLETWERVDACLECETRFETWETADASRECAGEPEPEAEPALDGRRSQLCALALSLSDPRRGRLASVSAVSC